MSNTIEIFIQKVAKMKTDILIVGSGCSGLYCALNLPRGETDYNYYKVRC